MKAAQRKMKWELLHFQGVFGGLRYIVRLTPAEPFRNNNGRLFHVAFTVEVTQTSSGRVEKFRSASQPNRTNIGRWIREWHDTCRKEDGQ
jgi:hypothetical protein